MLDINIIRDQPDLVKTSLKNRQLDPKLVDQAIKADQDGRKILSQVEELRASQNKISRQIKGKPTEDQIKAGSKLKSQLKELEPQLKKHQQQLTEILELIPNIPADDVPIGKDDGDNKVIKTVGQPPKFDFDPLDHVDLGKKLDIIDIRRAAKVSGSRFGYFKNQAATLEMAVMFYSFQKLVKKGWIAMVPPVMVKKDSEAKMGYTNNKNLDNAYYSLPDDDLVLISTSEHSVIPYHMDEIIPANKLPQKFVNFSPCFRRESGTYGQDTRGMFRVHFFNKVEMDILSLPDTATSDNLCQQMLSIQEEIMADFKLPYQIVSACTGDLPQPNRRMFDINCWFPGQNNYRETHSCSNCTDYQSRRLNIKTKVNGKLTFVHILNATVVTDRIVLAIIENFQQKDGSIKIPPALKSLTNFDTIKPVK